LSGKKLYDLNSDIGKLNLAGIDIYDYDNGDLSKKDLYDKYGELVVIDEFVDPKSGFSGYALQDPSGDIVIAYVGTQPHQEGKGDLITDGLIASFHITGLWPASLPQMNQADRFYQKIKESNPDTKISLTGHSLGGALANTVAMRNLEDPIDVLTLNPAPILNLDVVRFGYGFDNERIRNVVNENDPLYLGVISADMVIPGQVFRIPNGKGHSYGFVEGDFDNDGNLIWFDKLTNKNETGYDFFPGFYELSKSAGDVYEGITGNKIGGKEVGIVVGASVLFPTVVGGVSIFVVGLMTLGDQTALRVKITRMLFVGAEKTIQFCEDVIDAIRTGVSNAINWIENSLLKMREMIDAALEQAFNIAFQVFKAGVGIYLSVGDILSIARKIGLSYLEEFKDIFKGDFVVDANIEHIVANHIASRYQNLKSLFMQDQHKGVNKGLLNDIKNDIKHLGKEIEDLSTDVKDAVVIMVERDEELKNELYHALAF
jgi:hypothetical protein